MDVFKNLAGLNVVDISSLKDVQAMSKIDFDHLNIDARQKFDVCGLTKCVDRVTSLRVYGSNFDWPVLHQLVNLQSLDLYDAPGAEIDLNYLPRLSSFKIDLRASEVSFGCSDLKILKVAGLRTENILSGLRSIDALMVLNSQIESINLNIDVLGVCNAPKLQSVIGGKLASFDTINTKALAQIDAPNLVILKVLASKNFNIEEILLSYNLVSLWIAKIAPMKNLSWLYNLERLIELIFDDNRVMQDAQFANYLNQMNFQHLRLPGNIKNSLNIIPTDWGFLPKVSPKIRRLCELRVACL